MGEPLYLDVVAALKGTKFDQVKILTGRYGLAPRILLLLRSLRVYGNTEKSPFTIGIVDDVTNLSLELGAPLVTTPEGTTNCKFWGLGADGTVGANKTPSRSSATTPICMLRHILITTPRSPAA